MSLAVGQNVVFQYEEKIKGCDYGIPRTASGVVAEIAENGMVKCYFQDSNIYSWCLPMAVVPYNAMKVLKGHISRFSTNAQEYAFLGSYDPKYQEEIEERYFNSRKTLESKIKELLHL